MEQLLTMRPFVPAKDYELSKRFYQALGFAKTMETPQITMLKLESYSFILQNFYLQELAENFMMQMMVRNVDEWWARVDEAALVAQHLV